MTQSARRVIKVGMTDVTVRISNRTTLEVAVTSNGTVVVRGPQATTNEEAAALVRRRRTWIYQQLAKIAERAPENPIKTLMEGETFTLHGRPTRLHISHESDMVASASEGTLTLGHNTARNLPIARQTLINLYSSATREWLKNNYTQITQIANKANLTARSSTRLRKHWTTYHPRNGLTVH
ncbi:YgjP-like metallopeptidase domain-containing protein [Streptomyces sp. NPDC048696]|uniref:YgjP-like metallopeptidase domain-containing protein n=1 Tax=Streptomyces sp. NPDC048696 TaxID=3365585 RepID=UPI00370FD5CC